MGCTLRQTVETVGDGKRLNNIAFASSSHLTRASQLGYHIHWTKTFVAAIGHDRL
ncbi:hypothetical protein M404DRAFT_995644 [Pisolithus tinctorius Marx 270]|uniref:Uncharacterized protein n=1 Tax=Pisolithus tinctorius Marx 270 TaxID=870435 RepID=A0A0C3PNL4_PISTI|nr:hypothetical protein M404DRAFT_995644 [Pisolithus tinctorius Marx 270]